MTQPKNTILLLLRSTAALLPLVPGWQTAQRRGSLRYAVEDVESWDEGTTEVLLRASPKVVASSPEWLFLGIPIALVGLLLLLSNVVTVAVDDTTPPPVFSPEDDSGGRRLPLLRDWAGFAAPPSPVPPAEAKATFEIVAIASRWQLFQATLYQWRVFSLETKYPTGFYAGGNDDALIELLRAVFGFFSQGLANRETYESRCELDVKAGTASPTRALPEPPRFDAARRPQAIVRDCQAFVPDFGLSVAARDQDTTLGITSLRVRTLPPASYPAAHGADDDDQDQRYRHVGYITGLAVSRTARRRGVATTLVEFCARKAEAWGAAALCLHVNKLNQPALRFYDALGFELVDDWLGYNPQRFLLLRSFHDTTPPPHRAGTTTPVSSTNERPAAGPAT